MVDLEARVLVVEEEEEGVPVPATGVAVATTPREMVSLPVILGLIYRLPT